MDMHGAGDVSLGGGGIGFNPPAMMAGIAVGGTVGQNIAGTMNGMIAGINQPAQTGTVPPPIPTVAYHVAVNGQPTGPFDLSTLSEMVKSGQLTRENLIWKAGMNNWTKVSEVQELKGIFGDRATIPPEMPPIPEN